MSDGCFYPMWSDFEESLQAIADFLGCEIIVPGGGE